MANVILFHHAQGLTPGVHAFADNLRAAGHHVTVPDLYEGATFATVEEGVAHAKKIGFGVILERGVAAARELPPDAKSVVYAGFSLGAMPAQKLAQTQPNALVAILYHSAVPLREFSEAWPKGVALQVHLNRHDPWEELPAIEEIVRDAGRDAELFVYPGQAHLFTDSSLADYEPDSARLALQRTLDLLERLADQR